MRGSTVPAAGSVGLLATPDTDPRRLYFVRSDQFSFVKHGVPSLFVIPGEKDARGDSRNNHAIEEAWMDSTYHSPKDEWHADLRWAEVAKFTAFELALGLRIANADARPRWNEGDFYAPHR